MTRFRRRIGSALAGALVAGVVLAAPAAAVTPIAFTIYVNEQCVYGTGEATTGFVIRLLNSSGDLIQRNQATSSGFGSWSTCFDAPVTVGDKVRASGGGSDRTVTVPNLRMYTNRVTDKVTGHWIPNTPMTVCVTHYSGFNSSTNACLGPTSGATGSYSVDFTAEFNVRGGDYASAGWTSGSDYFAVSADFAFMRVTRNSPYVAGALNAGEVATIRLRDGANNLRATAVAQNGQYGDFSTYFVNSNGNYVRPRVGDIVVGNFETDASITIPDIKVSGVAGTDVVSGKCMANRPYMVYARKYNYSDSVTRYGTTNGTGHFTVDITADVDLANGDVLELTCMYVRGDQIRVLGNVTN